ncbi:MAG: hypothetical protein OSB66_05845 [SAR202 cluster bacterium]|nr:hypothetical protein [SAR202 cluster bacterium]
MQTIFGLEFPVFAAAILLADLQIGKADPSINLMKGIVSMVETGKGRTTQETDTNATSGFIK